MMEGNKDNKEGAAIVDRRHLFQNAGIIVSGVSFLSPRKVMAEVDNMGRDPEHPIVVVGAGGKVRLLSVCTAARTSSFS
jgi:hypothetical protein